MPKVERVVIAKYDGYDLDGTLEGLIEMLQVHRSEGLKQGLTNIYVSSEYRDEPLYEYGGYQGKTEQMWSMEITGEKPPARFKTKLPRKLYDKSFERGVMAAHDGHERESNADGTREGEAFYDGFDSIKSIKDVHTEHCCIIHGCKYGDPDCTVVTESRKQSYPCESCHDAG